MSEFVYLYREELAARPSPQAMQERMQRWLAWMKDLEQKGHLVNYGHPLVPTAGAVVKKASSTDGPYAETKDIVMGFTIIQANDLQQAMQLSLGCPILDRGGSVEVRPILKL